MTSGIYHHIFHKSASLTHQLGKNGVAKRNVKKKWHATDTLRSLLLSILLIGGAIGSERIATADTILPAGTIPTGLSEITGNITIHSPVINPDHINGQLLKIDQSAMKGIIEGTNFNIDKFSAVRFNHTYDGTGSATLIRINGPKSIIEGALNSPNGSIYLINPNGILFGNGARVDTNGLVASALNLSNSDFLRTLGHLNSYLDGGRAAYVWGGDATGFQEVLLQVMPDARIKAALGSSVMLFAPKVINQGSIQTSEGQIALAAGEKVYLSVAPDLNGGTAVGTYNYTKDSPYKGLAGVLVEVDSPNYIKKDINGNEVLDGNGNPVKLTGEVVNDTMGRILAQRGNVTMASFLVNQDGRVTATSSATQKGSIRLLARDTTSDGFASIEPNGRESQIDFSTRLNQNGTANTIISGLRTGKLTVGANSITAILAEDNAALVKTKEIFAAQQVGEPAVQVGEISYVNDVLNAVNVKGSTLTDDQVFISPTIEGLGRQVTIGDNAKIVAPGGFIYISAQKLGLGFNVGDATTAVNSKDSESRLFMGNNTLIDTAGLKNVVVDMERNFVEVLLTLTDLKNNSLNRDGFLYRKKVWFDIRDTPDSRVADLAGFVDQVPRSLGEKLATAGDVKLMSEGDLIQSSSSKVDVSGGSLKFNDGLNKESWIVGQNGKAYALGDAPVDTLFTQFLGGSNTRKLHEAGYIEGKLAGTASIDAYDMVLDGQINGGATYGEYQRESKNLGGKLAINVMTQGGSSGHDVTIFNITPLNANFIATDPLPSSRLNTVEVDSNMLSRSGFESVFINTTSNIKVNTAIRMVDGGYLSLSGRDIEVNENIVIRGGSLSLKSVFTEGSVTADDINVKLADGVTLDMSGNWVNDKLSNNDSRRVITDGGKVSISSGDEVKLGAGSLVDVSGGGWLQESDKVVNGDAGSIHIASQVGQGRQDNPFTYIAPELKGELRGFAIGTGGELSITAPFITIGNTGFGSEREFLATPEFFQSSGFTGFNLSGRDGVLVKSNTNVAVIAKSYLLNRGFQLNASGGHLYDFATLTFLPDYSRSTSSLVLSTLATNNELPADAFLASGVKRGGIVLETGSSLKVDANGFRINPDGKRALPTIALSAWDNQIFIDGTLQAPGGDISLTMNGDATSESDPGYNPSQTIWLGGNAKLLAAGYSRNTPTGSRLIAGIVYDGGNIILDAKKGYVVAETSSVIDVSGSSAIFDVKNTNGYTPTKVVTKGGNVSISAREGMLLDSSFKATSTDGLGGSLEVQLTRGSSRSIGLKSALYPGTAPSIENGFNQDLLIDQDQLWYVDLSQSGTFVPASLKAGDSIRTFAGGLAKISIDKIMSAGFSGVALKSEYGVRFTGDADLVTSRSLSFNTKVLEASNGSTVKLTSPNVIIANDVETMPLRPNNEYQAATALLGDANLIVNSNLLNLNGQFALSHFATTTLNSTGDIRMTGVSDPNVQIGELNQTPLGKLVTAGELNFNARQLYPTSLSDFTITVNGPGSKVTFNKINPNGGYDIVLSAGGKLNVNAETINQNGVLIAPFGTIALNAIDTLNLNSGSLTSVSAGGSLIPFGYTDRDGLDFLYDFGPNSQQFKAPPERSVILNAPIINQKDKSSVDISGGDDLFAYEWVPGIGGSSDVLAANANQSAFGRGTINTWAIMPAKNQTFAGFDTQYWQGSHVQAGDAVYISGIVGLAEGYYTLLPARYALLPGAMLLSSVSGYQDIASGSSLKLANGSTIVSGHLAAYTDKGYIQTSRTAGFVLRPGADAYKLAQYNTTYASTYFKANTEVQKPADAGLLSIAATYNLVLNGFVNAKPGQGGFGAEVNIAAPKLLVVGAGEQTGQVNKDGITYLAIDDQTLVNFKVASLLLGGSRSNGKLGVIASNVRMSENANLSGPEVILAATDEVVLDAGARIKGTGGGATAKNLTIGALADTNGNVSVDGDGALVRVSAGPASKITRLNSDGNRGNLIVGLAAIVSGDGSLLLDTSKEMDIKGDIEFAAGAALGFSASRISLGSPDNNKAVAEGLWLKQSQLDKFVDAGSLLLQSKSTVDLYGDASFGNNNFDMTLQTAGIAGFQNAGKTATITTRNLTLANNDNAIFVQPAPALVGGTVPDLVTGKLNIKATKVVAGNNTVHLAGFDQIEITASKEFIVQGNEMRDSNQRSPNKLVVDKNLTINTPRITASNNADYEIVAGDFADPETGGLLKVQGTIGAQPELNTAVSQGAKLKLSGDQVLLAGGTTDVNSMTERHGALIDMPGGITNLEATGLNATDNIILENGSRILAQGSAYSLNNQTVDLPAGQVFLTSKNGDVSLQQGALVDLTATGIAEAGKLVISAVKGETRLAGNIKAAAAGSLGKNAIATIDTKVIVDMSKTISTLSTFSGAQTYRVRGDAVVGGDVIISSFDNIKAKDIKIMADNGKIVINGKIDASSDKGGSIEVFAKHDVTVNSGAELLAKGMANAISTAGSLGNGGDVLLSSESGVVSTAKPASNGLGGALIDVSGDQLGSIKGEGGEVIFRVARKGLGAGNEVNVDIEVAAAVTGANRVLVEAVKKYNIDTINTEEISTISNETNTFVTNIAALMGSFHNTRDGKTPTIAPGVEVNSATNLVLSTDWNLGNSHTNSLIPSGGILTLRAAGDLKLNGNIDYEQFNAGNSLTQKFGNWSYRLVAGADASAVNPESVIQDNGDIALENAKFVRTGTGFIHAAAGDDIELGANGNKGAAIYTEGLGRLIAQGAMEINSPGDFRVLITNNFGIPSSLTSNREVYADGGGDVVLNAGGEVSGSATSAETQDVKKWLYHAALANNTINPQARWWSRYNNFTNGVAALGGGDVKVVAGSNVSNIQVASATNGRMGGDVNTAPDIINFSELGGGDVSVKADGSVSQVLLHAGKGEISAKSGRDINTSISIMNSIVNLVATKNIEINSTSNPTLGGSAVNGANNKVVFYTYDDQSSINAISKVGDVIVRSDDRAFPSKLTAVAPEGDINIKNVVLYPSVTGNATILAGNNVAIDSLIMSEVNPDSLPLIDSPQLKSAVNKTISELINYNNTSGHTDGFLHKDDNEPVRIYAQNDITFKVQNPLVTPKRVEIKAGHDVVDPNVIAQNIKATDVSVITAGNAIRYNEPVRNGDSIIATEAGIQIAGPGRLHLIGGRDIDLGTSDGVRSVGNLYNLYLPEQGADIFANAGASAVADYNGILNAYVDVTSQYSNIYLPQLTAFMRKLTDDHSLLSSRALANFKLLDRSSQTAFINHVFFTELKTAGRETIKAGNDDYSRSERAILHMFPSFTTNQNLVSQSGSLMQDFGKIANEKVLHPGDLNLFYSQIRSERGGRIEILVPGGLINAGLAVAGNLQKLDTNLGIVSLRGGELLALVRNDFQVNQSRVFTLGGSNLMLYSALADIDAGKGSKTSSSTPPPVIRIVDGKVTYDYSGAVSGSGIAALTATGGKPGDVDLFAPYGEINAGEAGIRSEGNINIGARVVIGADNIKAGGVTSGVTAPSTANVSFSAPVSADSSSSAKQSDKATEAASKSANRTANALPSLITVEVLALGDETSTASDSEKDEKKKVKKSQN